jgi:hypothetical protein
MVILVIAVAAIIASIVFGLAVFFPKSAYIVVQTEAKNVSPDNWYLSVSHMNGDAAYLNHTLATNEGMPVDFQFTNTTLGTIIPKPDPADGPETWKPGDTLFVYRNQSRAFWVTKNETRAIDETKKSGAGLPQGVWQFDVVDKTDDVLIYSKKVGVGVTEPTTIPTTIPNTSVTTTIPTTNATTVPTTVTPTLSIPTITSIAGSIEGNRGTTVTNIQIIGTNFLTPPAPTVIFIKGSDTMTATVTSVSSTMVTVTLNIPPGQALGRYYIKLTNYDGGTVTSAGSANFNVKP